MTEPTFAPVAIGDIREGDIVRATRDDVAVIAPIVDDSTYGLYLAIPFASIQSDDIELDELESAGFTFERRSPALPTGLFAVLHPTAPAFAAAIRGHEGWHYVYGDGSTAPADDAFLVARIADGGYVIATEGRVFA